MNEEKRHKRLQALIAQLTAGKDAAPRDIQLALLPDEWEQYEVAIESQRNLKAMLSKTPPELKRYLAALRRADLLQVRAEAMVCSDNARTRASLYRLAEQAYEEALVVLGEALGLRPDLRMWLDRDLMTEFHNATSCDQLAVPRLLSSTSSHKTHGLASQPRRQIKLAALQESLSRMLDKTEHQPAKAEKKPASAQIKLAQKSKRLIDTSGWKI